jgi:hypothetical protein
MNVLSNRNQIAIGLALFILMVVTRGEHFATVASLPSASWAVFFLAGFYMRPLWVFPLGFVAAWGIDFMPYLFSGVNLMEVFQGGRHFCITPAYLFLLPAYGALWLAGRWYAGQYRFELRTLFPLFSAAIVGALFCELFSSGGFYLFSGRFVDQSVLEFAGRFVKYFPGSLQSLLFYTGVSVLMHATIRTALDMKHTDQIARM